MLVEFADVVELGGNLPNQQLGVKREWDPFIEALVVWFVKVWSAQRRKMNPLFSHKGVYTSTYVGKQCFERQYMIYIHLFF